MKTRMLNNSAFVRGMNVCCLLIILLLSGCRTAKVITSGGSPLRMTTAEAFFETYKGKAFQFNTLSANIQFEVMLSPGNVTSSRGQLKITKDDRIQLSIKPLLGIEVLRAELTSDSIKIVNRLNRWYMVEAFDNIKGGNEFDFNFYNLQSLLTHQLFLPGEMRLADDRLRLFRWEQTQSGYLLQTNDRTGLLYAFAADSNESLLTTTITDNTTNFKLACSYADPVPTGSQLFPANLLIFLHTESLTQHSLALHFSRLEIDGPLEMNFPIPANYQRVSLQQILHSIENL